MKKTKNKNRQDCVPCCINVNILTHSQSCCSGLKGLCYSLMLIFLKTSMITLWSQQTSSPPLPDRGLNIAVLPVFCCYPSQLRWCFHWHPQPRQWEHWTGHCLHHGSQIWTGILHLRCTPGTGSHSNCTFQHQMSLDLRTIHLCGNNIVYSTYVDEHNLDRRLRRFKICPVVSASCTVNFIESTFI